MQQMLTFHCLYGCLFAPPLPPPSGEGGGRYTSFIYANGVSVLLLIYGMGSAKAPIDG